MHKRFLLPLMGAILLSGCNAEHNYGIANDRWAALSPQQRSQVEQQYTQTQNALAEEQRNTIVNPNAHEIRVAVYGGRALMPPFHWYQPYDTEVVDIKEGTCETCTLHRPDGEKAVDLTLCYRDHELEIDPSKFVFDKRHGTLAFHESPIWKKGFTYTQVKTSGYARLKNAHIYVKQLS